MITSHWQKQKIARCWGQMMTGFRVFEPGIMLGGKTANTIQASFGPELWLNQPREREFGIIKFKNGRAGKNFRFHLIQVFFYRWGDRDPHTLQGYPQAHTAFASSFYLTVVEFWSPFWVQNFCTCRGMGAENMKTNKTASSGRYAKDYCNVKSWGLWELWNSYIRTLGW